MIRHEIDPQAILQRAGHSIGAARQLLFFHPDLLVRLLQADQSALLEAPLRFAVMELPDGAVTIRWFNHALSFARYDNPALTNLGRELAATCERIVSDAFGDTPLKNSARPFSLTAARSNSAIEYLTKASASPRTPSRRSSPDRQAGKPDAIN